MANLLYKLDGLRTVTIPSRVEREWVRAQTTVRVVTIVVENNTPTPLYTLVPALPPGTFGGRALLPGDIVRVGGVDTGLGA